MINVDSSVYKRGAEAEIRFVDFLGEKAIAKFRIPKGYRIPQIDGKLRRERTRREARLINAVKYLGIPCPFIYHIDTDKGLLIMEYIEGPRLRDLLLEISQGNFRDELKAGLFQHILVVIGGHIGRLHSNAITHGDLTTSNMLLKKESHHLIIEKMGKGIIPGPDDFEIYFIDMSLGEKDAILEDIGEDLDVFQKAFESTHPELLFHLNSFWSAYSIENDDHNLVKKKLAEIKKRARYR